MEVDGERRSGISGSAHVEGSRLGRARNNNRETQAESADDESDINQSSFARIKTNTFKPRSIRHQSQESLDQKVGMQLTLPWLRTQSI